MIYPVYYIFNETYPYEPGNPSTMTIYSACDKTCLVQLKLPQSNQLLLGYGMIHQNGVNQTINIQFDYTSNGFVNLQIDGEKGILNYFFINDNVIQYEMSYTPPLLLN